MDVNPSPTRQVTLQRVGALFGDWRRLLISFAWFCAASSASLSIAISATRAQAPLLSGEQLILTALSVLGLACANFALTPALIWLRAPINPFVTSGLAVLSNAGLLLVCTDVWFDARLDGAPHPPLTLAAALAFGNALANGAIALDDDYTFLQFVLASLRYSERSAAPSKSRGLVIIEVDGLSYSHLRWAVALGFMPTVAELLSTSHTLARYDSGLPSQTSAAQAGLFYGVNHDIPAFRWYDRRHRRMVVSNHPEHAAMIDARHSTGQGLLRGGVSINNLLDGDAARALLTLSTLAPNAQRAAEHAYDDLIAFWFNPYTFGRTAVLSVLDLVREIAQALRERLARRQPRLDHRFPSRFTVLRMLTNVFLRDLAFFAVMREMQRGQPIIYATFVGYDEVAHHAGPSSLDALATLRGLDRHLRHVLTIARFFAPISYDLLLLSDHGQSSGAPFRQRYGYSLRELIDALTRAEVRVEEQQPRAAGQSFMNALLSEMDAASEQLRGVSRRRWRRATMRATVRTLRPRLEGDGETLVHRPSIIVCVSGNLAHVYFEFGEDQRATLDQIEATHPGLIEALVSHPGIGFVVGTTAEAHVVVLGKGGQRDLTSGDVEGEDPLQPFGDVALRALQLLQLAQLPSSGDLIVNSALYTDGSVASFEDQVGTHGGLGGEQTDAFVLYPRTFWFPQRPVSSAQALHCVLASWRGSALREPLGQR
ncbi:MAG: alkaline phosphatase family protein [Anaerolineae bacterium]|nr:alkaline phosphatase family protein [Anaerolineae bacterium]